MPTKYFIFNTLLILPLFLLIGGGAWTLYGSYLLLLVLAISFIIYPEHIKSFYFNKNSKFLYFFLLYIFLSSQFNINYTASIYVRIFPIVLFSIEYCLINQSQQNRKHARFFLLVFIAIFLWYCIQAIIYVQQNPIGLREIISTEKDDSIIIGGGFAMPYSCALFCPFLLYRSIKATSIKVKIILITICVICLYLTFKSLYMTALIICLFGCVYVLIMGRPTIQKVLISLFAIVLCFAGYASFPILLQHISGDEMVLLLRFEEIDSILNGNDISQSTDFFSRILLSLKSLMTFIENPLFGIGWISQYDFFEMEKLGVGSHAQWFDLFACYGIFALFLVLFIFKSSTRIVCRNNPGWLFWVILGFLNPNLQFNIIFVIFCIIPLINVLWPVPVKKVLKVNP